MKLRIPSIILATAVVAVPIFPPAAHGQSALDFAKLDREMNVLVPELMNEHGVAGAQVFVFDGTRTQSFAFGHRDPDFSVPVETKTIFQAADLVRPLTAYLTLQDLHAEARGTQDDPAALLQSELPADAVPDFPVRSDVADASLQLERLLTMTAGFAASRDGLLRGEEERPDAAQYLRERLRVRTKPGTLIAISPESYAYLGRRLEHRRQRPFSEIARDALRGELRMRSSCIQKEDCADAERITAGLTHVDRFFFVQQEPHVLYPAADSLYTTADEYGAFLRELARRYRSGDPVVQAMFERVYRYDPRLGGMSAGAFHAMCPPPANDSEAEVSNCRAETSIYRVEGRQPGFAALAFLSLSGGGRGAVILANGNERFFPREVFAYLVDRFGLLPQNPGAVPHAQSYEVYEGTYRPRNVLPAGARLFSFLSDVRIGIDSEGGRAHIALGSVLQEDADVSLYPLNVSDVPADLFLARGQAEMDGWRLRMREDGGFDTDLVRFDAVPFLFSALAIFVYLGLLTSLPVLLFMLYLIRRGHLEKH